MERDYSQQSRAISWILDYVVDTHSHMLTNGVRSVYLLRQHLFAATPGSHQGWRTGRFSLLWMGSYVLNADPSMITLRATYSGYNRVHGLKFQGAVLPNGLLVTCTDWPVAGSRHDAYIFGMSNPNPEVANMQEGEHVQHVVYGDTASSSFLTLSWDTNEPPTFSQVRWLPIRPYQWPGSASRSFGKLVQHFPILDYKKKLKLHLQPIANLYITATVLINMPTGLYGRVTGSGFEQSPRS
ncbi:unnamed protein product [Discosporangium mesarthrocarpum]